jgi:hypothetical protein
LYFNPRDPGHLGREPYRAGSGVNMGNPRAWLLIAGMMLVPMIADRLLF